MSQDVTYPSLLSTSDGVHYFSFCLNRLQYSLFVLWSVHKTFSICLHIHISNPSSHQISSFCKGHILFQSIQLNAPNTFTIHFLLYAGLHITILGYTQDSPEYNQMHLFFLQLNTLQSGSLFHCGVQGTAHKCFTSYLSNRKQ